MSVFLSPFLLPGDQIGGAVLGARGALMLDHRKRAYRVTSLPNGSTPGTQEPHQEIYHTRAMILSYESERAESSDSVTNAES